VEQGECAYELKREQSHVLPVPPFRKSFLFRTGELMRNLVAKKAKRAPLENGSAANGCYGLPPGGFLLVFVFVGLFYLAFWISGFIDTTIDHLLQTLSSVSISCYKIYCLPENLITTPFHNFSRCPPVEQDWLALSASKTLSCHVAIPRKHHHDAQINQIPAIQPLTPHVRPIDRKTQRCYTVSVYRSTELSSRSLLANLHVSVSARRSTDSEKDNVPHQNLGKFGE
jgi:hypothetical protein